MKKINKIFAAATASLLCFFSMTALSGNAMYWCYIPNDEEKALEIIRENMFYDTDTFKDFALDTERVFATPNTVVYFTSNRGMCRIEANTRVLDFSMKTASSFSKEDTETVKAFLNELYPDVEFDVKMDGKAKFSIFLHNKKWGSISILVALGIAFSRMYLFVHFPTDILGGAILGSCISLAVHKIAKKIEKKKVTTT